MNPHQVSKIDITPEVVDCIVFWTKNPEPMLNRLDELTAYDYYFQFTLTGYGKDIEISSEPGARRTGTKYTRAAACSCTGTDTCVTSIMVF